MAGTWRSETIYPLTMRLFDAFLVLSILSYAAMGSDAKEGASQPLFNVGYQILDLKYRKDREEKVLTVAVWYPTAARPEPYNYGGPTGGKVAVDAAPLVKTGPCPLLVFSHGYGSGGISSVFFTEALAAHGWIVVAPDHHDKHSAIRIRSGQLKSFDREDFYQHAQEIATSGPEDRDKYLYRLDEMRSVIDRMIVSKTFRDVIDSNRIAVGGHSFGGYTALGLCGTIKERHDSRIKAVLLFSTGAGGYLYRKDELSAVRIPSMLFIGEREKDQLRGSETMSELSSKIYRNVSLPKYFLEVKGASHFSFNNRFADNRRARLLSGTEKQFEVIRRYSIAFLENHVAGRKNWDPILERSDPLLIRYVREPCPDAFKQELEAPDKTIRRAESDAPADA